MRMPPLAFAALAAVLSLSASVRAEAPVTGPDGRVSAFGKTYQSVEAYQHSPEFVAAGLRCGTPEIALPDLPLDFAPSDCSLSQTSIQGDYDPAAGEEYVISVVVHVLATAGGTGNLSDALVESQIDILNEDFNALAGTPGGPGTNGKIRFVLATTDPDGNPTNGIDRVAQFHTNADGATVRAWDPNRYLNIYTANLGGGILGYVQAFPQQIAGQSGDGAFILYTSFGRNSPGGGVFNQGRTLTHEIGHYMGLRHIWGDESTCNNGYTSGDLVADTVPSTGPASGCPTAANTCGQGNDVRNYMDYSDDLCMNRFSPEQVNRMRCVMAHYRSQLYNALPTADFLVDASDLVVSFTDQSTDADGQIASRTWDFGDGGTSTETSPTHTYADFGLYDVTLTVTDDRGVRGSKTETITVNIAPFAGFDFSVDGVEVDFTDTSSDPNGTIVAWEWSFGDGETSTEASPSHSYATLAVYNVSLTVTDDLGSKTTVAQDLDLVRIEEEDGGGCGCSSSGGGGPLGALALFALLLGVRRRRARTNR